MTQPTDLADQLYETFTKTDRALVALLLDLSMLRKIPTENLITLRGDQPLNSDVLTWLCINGRLAALRPPDRHGSLVKDLLKTAVWETGPHNVLMDTADRLLSHYPDTYELDVWAENPAMIGANIVFRMLERYESKMSLNEEDRYLDIVKEHVRKNPFLIQVRPEDPRTSQSVARALMALEGREDDVLQWAQDDLSVRRMLEYFNPVGIQKQKALFLMRTFPRVMKQTELLNQLAPGQAAKQAELVKTLADYGHVTLTDVQHVLAVMPASKPWGIQARPADLEQLVDAYERGWAQKGNAIPTLLNLLVNHNNAMRLGGSARLGYRLLLLLDDQEDTSHQPGKHGGADLLLFFAPYALEKTDVSGNEDMLDLMRATTQNAQRLLPGLFDNKPDWINRDIEVNGQTISLYAILEYIDANVEEHLLLEGLDPPFSADLEMFRRGMANAAEQVLRQQARQEQAFASTREDAYIL